MARSAVLFDIDGTLVDSNYQHVEAWARAFSATGLPVATWRIHRHIGMDGDELISTLTSDPNDAVRQRLSELHSAYYKESTSLLAVLPGARELLHRVAEAGLQVVLATSAPEDELQLLREVLDCEDVISAVTSSADVDMAKPDPSIVQVALDRAGVEPARAVFVGDAVWDAKAARSAGVICIGLRSGGIADSELENAGATAIYDDASELLACFDSSPITFLPR